MMFKSRRIIQQQGGPLADLAFMLLFFFMVTTDMKREEGIPTMLPPKDVVPVSTPRVMKLLLNGQNDLMIDGKKLDISLCKTVATNQILDYPETSFEVQTHNNCSYNSYLLLYDAVRSAYISLYQKQAKEKFGKSFKELENNEKREITKRLPMRIVELNSISHNTSSIVD